MNIKTFITVVKIEMSKLDFVFHFAARGGVWISPINEESANIFNSFFESIYKAKINDLIILENINSVTVDGERLYTKVFSFESLYKQNKSFFVFEENNIKYMAVHFDNFSCPLSKRSIILNKKITAVDRVWQHKNGEINALCDDTQAKCLLTERVTLDSEGDSLNYDIIRIDEASATLINDNGMFDDFNNFYGNKFVVKKVFDGDNYSEAKTVFFGFIKTPEYNFLDTVTITASDLRGSFLTELPKKVFNEKDYPLINNFPVDANPEAKDILNKRVPLVYGRGVTVKLTPIKYETRAGYTPEIVFKICDTANTAIENIVLKNDKLDGGKTKPHLWFIEKAREGSKTLTGDLEMFVNEYRDFNDGKGIQKNWTLDKEKGTITFTGDRQVKNIVVGNTDGGSGNDDIYELFIEIDKPPYKSLEIIREILEKYEQISFTKENFFIEEWLNEEAKSKEVAININDDNTITSIDLIGKLCYLERGRISYVDEKIKYISSKERKIKYAFKHFELGRVDISLNSDEYLSSVDVSYDAEPNTKKIQNYDFEEAAKKRHVITVHEEIETLLKNEEDAREFSELTLKDRYILKDYYTFECYKYLSLELYDLVVFYYMRDDKKYFIKPCVCEILKLNIYDETVKLRKISDDITSYLPENIKDWRELWQ